MTTKQRIAKINKSLELQRRTLANLESMELADDRQSITLTKQIIANLEAHKQLLTSK